MGRQHPSPELVYFLILLAGSSSQSFNSNHLRSRSLPLAILITANSRNQANASWDTYNRKYVGSVAHLITTQPKPLRSVGLTNSDHNCSPIPAASRHEIPSWGFEVVWRTNPTTIPITTWDQCNTVGGFFLHEMALSNQLVRIISTSLRPSSLCQTLQFQLLQTWPLIYRGHLSSKVSASCFHSLQPPGHRKLRAPLHHLEFPRCLQLQSFRPIFAVEDS